MTSQPSSVPSRNRRLLGAWLATAFACWAGLFAVAWFGVPDGLVAGAAKTLGSRLSFAVAHLFAASLTLFLGFLAVGATRWRIETQDSQATAVGPQSAAPRDVRNRVANQFLGNTAEQFLMFTAAVLAASMTASVGALHLISVATLLWIVGRLFFWIGYHYTATRNLPTYPRAIGLGLGLLTTLFVAGVAAVGICLHFPDFAAVPLPVDVDAAIAQGAWLIEPAGSYSMGLRLIPVVLFSAVIIGMAVIASVFRPAPPVIGITIVSTIGWGYVLLSGTIPLR